MVPITHFFNLPMRALALASLCWIIPFTHAQPAREYDLKAAFLFNFAQFIDWPTEAFSSPADPFIIAILGEDPFGRALDEVLRDETISGRSILLKRCRALNELPSCQILFISKSEAIPQVLPFFKSRPILTVSDDADFAARGGIIQFFTDKSRIRLRINLAAARRSGLTLSSKLLRASEIISTEDNP